MAFESAVAVYTGLTQLSSLAAHTADNITDKWYEVSKELEDFQELEKKLKRKVDIWKEALRNEGMSDDIHLREPLDDAIKCLEGEKIKMDTVQSNCCMFRIMFMFKAQPFPPLLKDSMQRVVDAFDNIQNAYAESTEPARILGELANNHLDLYQIVVDTRIIKLADTQDKVMQHLEAKAGNQVVTLYGGAGSGKTSLAKLVAQHYQENKTIFADGARFLTCGHNATFDSICEQLFQSLGISDVNIDSAPEAKAEQALKPKGTPSEGQSSGVLALVKKLARRLKERHLLIIFDDVSNPDLLKEKLIVPHARNVKYLITSQRRDIYDGATLIHMQQPTLEEAMKILIKYIPNSSNGEIPTNLQEKAKQIIQKAESLPMTLATVGRQIDDFDDEQSWNIVLNNFNDLFLSSEQAYGDKLAISMLVAVDALGDSSDTQKLLYLIAMCELVYVPEEVLQLLFRRIDSKHLSTFKKHEKNLKDRDLIIVGMEGWILSSTYQPLILKYKKEDVSKLLCTLIQDDDNDDDNELIKILCALYILSEKDIFSSAATLALEEVANTFNISLANQNMRNDFRKAIYYLIHLLYPSREAKDGKECEIRHHRLASKIIKQFISKQDLDDESLCQLLEEKDIYEDICNVLIQMHNFTEVQKQKPILTKDTSLTLEELIFNLIPTAEDIVTTVETLLALCHEENCDLILDNDHVLMNLLEILHSDDTEEKRSYLICTTLICLGNLAQSSTAKEKIASCEGLIEALIAIFYMDSDVTNTNDMLVKVNAMSALESIASQKKTSNILVKTPNFLASVAQLLEDIYFKDQDRKFILEHGHFSLTYSTIRCLRSLLVGNYDNKGDICKHEHLMHVLTKIFETYNSKKISNDNNYEGYITGDENVAGEVLELLTLIDPVKYNKVILHSKETYLARGNSNEFCGLYKQAFEDYKRADRIDNFNDTFYKTKLCFLKCMLKDYKGALLYAKWAIDENPNDFFVWQESGVLKELMEDYEGAKNDLNKALELRSNDYEILKHRAYVNFKLSCEKEAHEDAKKALQLIPIFKIDKPDSGQCDYLGALSVPQFLDYDFR